jgi:hypothetical protein
MDRLTETETFITIADGIRIKRLEEPLVPARFRDCCRG